jgi:glycosyltransferase involved in cell wall biosynthesis
MGDLPAVTVVVPVRNAVGTIDHCIRALLTQDYPHNRFEILIVDNNSNDGTRSHIETFENRLIVLDEPKRGASAARNAGIRRAASEMIAFTDADCVPERSWIRELVRHYLSDGQTDIIGGRIEPYQPVTAIERFAGRLMNQEAAISHKTKPYVISANMLARRSDLLRLGLFDDGILRGQDVDLSVRAHFDYGLRLGYANRAVVRHVNVNTVRALFEKGEQHGLARFNVLGKHSRRIGLTPLKSLLRLGVNLSILRNLLLSLGLPLASMFGGITMVDKCRACLYQGIFDLGKQWGLLKAIICR